MSLLALVWPRLVSRPATFEQDAELVRRLRRGEEDAFEELFASSFEGLYRFALHRLGQNHELAKEIAQATLCKGFEKLDTYRGEAPIFSWLCAICRFEITAHFRRERREPPALELPEDTGAILGVLDSLSADQDDPERQALRQEVGRLVHLTVDHLPRQYALALEWRYADQVGVAEIAARLALSYKAAESLLSRARQAFRDGFTAVSAGAATPPIAAGRRS